MSNKKEFVLSRKLKECIQYVHRNLPFKRNLPDIEEYLEGTAPASYYSCGTPQMQLSSWRARPDLILQQDMYDELGYFFAVKKEPFFTIRDEVFEVTYTDDNIHGSYNEDGYDYLIAAGGYGKPLAASAREFIDGAGNTVKKQDLGVMYASKFFWRVAWCGMKILWHHLCNGKISSGVIIGVIVSVIVGVILGVILKPDLC